MRRVEGRRRKEWGEVGGAGGRRIKGRGID